MKLIIEIDLKANANEDDGRQIGKLAKAL